MSTWGPTEPPKSAPCKEYEDETYTGSVNPDLGYNEAPSDWKHDAVVTYPNGEKHSIEYKSPEFYEMREKLIESLPGGGAGGADFSEIERRVLALSKDQQYALLYGMNPHRITEARQTGRTTRRLLGLLGAMPEGGRAMFIVSSPAMRQYVIQLAVSCGAKKINGQHSVRFAGGRVIRFPLAEVERDRDIRGFDGRIEFDHDVLEDMDNDTRLDVEDLVADCNRRQDAILAHQERQRKQNRTRLRDAMTMSPTGRIVDRSKMPSKFA